MWRSDGRSDGNIEDEEDTDDVPAGTRVMAELPPQPGCEALLRQKYLQPGEHSRADLQRRVARALSLAEGDAGSPQARGWQQRFEQALHDGFIPGGRILAAAGAGAERCWMSCFVQPLGGPRDRSASPGPPLALALEQTLSTLQAGGGVGVDFSARDDVPQCLQAFEAVCERASQSRGRRGAMMGVLPIDHPQWRAFVRAKRSDRLRHFNLSVAVDDAFMGRLMRDEPAAQERWAALVQAAWESAEPGLLFIDTIGRDDSLAWRETIRATNPCGEQPLPAWGSCCLGSLELTRFVRAPLQAQARLDEAALEHTAAVAVRMLDNVVSLSGYPLQPQREQALGTRRIGLGLTGLGDALALLGLRYDSALGRAQAARIAQCLRDAAVQASVALARERGPFPHFDAARHLASPGFASRLPPALRRSIARDGLRNSHLLCVAPAGSISMALADNVSSGVEPVWAWRLQRRVHDALGRQQTLQLCDPVWRLWHQLADPRAALPPQMVTAAQVSPADQVAMVAAIAPFIDGAIAKTVQLRAEAPPQQVDAVLRQAWGNGLKGLSVYRPNPVRAPLLQPLPCDGFCASATS